jgi:predicted PurR-regulated permease PerM
MRARGFQLKTIRLAPQSGIDQASVIGARIAQILIALIVGVAALDYAEVILAPILLGVVIGLMFSPVAKAIERRGMPAWVSGLAIVILFIALVVILVGALAMPLSAWVDKAPLIWESLKLHIADWKDMISSFQTMQKQLGSAMGETGGVMVKVDQGGGAVESVVTLGPTIIAELLLFFASIYFFVATRDQFRVAVLKLCISRRVRWRIAHFFRDTELLISRYLMTITLVNIGLGCAVAFCLWLVGMPSPLLWGVLAAVLNYVVYVGPAMMAILLACISLASRHGGLDILTPPAIYLGLHFIESQFVTTQVLGVTMTMNPFLVFLALAFWIWLWGPVGGFIAVPSLLILYAFMRNTIKMRDRVSTV